MLIKIKVDGRLVLITAGCLCIAFSAVAIAFPDTAIWLPSNSSEMASWVQAAGSIIAIAATAIIARRDGLHREKTEKENELKHLKKAKFYLQKTDVLNSFEFFQVQWKYYDRLCFLNQNPDRIADLQKLFFFRFTKKSFFKLSNSIALMSDERREAILTGEYSHLFLHLFEIVEFYEKMYKSVEDVARAFPDDLYEDNIFIRFNEIEFHRLSQLNGYLATYFDAVMIHKNQFFKLLEELFSLASYEAR